MHNKGGGTTWEVWKDVVLSYIFPQFCLACNKEGRLLCSGCMRSMPIQAAFFVPDNALDGVWYVTEYQDDLLIGNIMHAYKYLYMTKIKDIMTDWIATASLGELGQVDYIVPIPLHKRRLAERGFNQAIHIAHGISQKIGAPNSSVLKRTKSTRQQARLSRKERFNNVADAFRITDISYITNKHILLVDDVYTTGATMNECARIIKEAGAASCTGFVIGKTT